MFGLDPTPFDLRFVAFRIPIRVHPSFWLVGLLLNMDLIPDHLDILFMWEMCLFVSILVHELGHGLMAEAFGWASEIVLYWCGGLAYSQRAYNRTPWREIAVALAGPFAGFGLYGLTQLVLYLIPDDVVLNRNVKFIIGTMIYINLYWGLVNLLPVLPLDGGHVCLHFLSWCGLRDPIRVATQISIPVAIAATAYFYLQESRFGAVLFGMLCLQNIVSLQSPPRSSW